MPRPVGSTAKKDKLTLAQLAAYDDILTDALIDHTFYWTTIPKNRTSYHPSRGVKEEEITKLIQNHLIVDPNLATAEEKLLATDGLKKFYNGLWTPKEKDDFKAHLRRYMSTYLPDCPFEVNATNRYTIVSFEASITARRFIRRNETIKYLAGIQVTITPEEEAQMALRKKDFSLVVSSRSKTTSLFMGPARFANHDCDANARLVTRGQAGIEIIACRDIDVGDEITVSYSDSYFGEDNCECLCQTCESKLMNGWKPADGSVSIQASIEEDFLAVQGYSFRRRRRDESAAGSSSRTPSVTPDIRPRVLKRQRSQMMAGDRASTTDSMEPGSAVQKRSLEVAFGTPPVTPAKRFKQAQYEVVSVPPESPISRGSSETEFARSPLSSEAGTAALTDATTPGPDSPSTLMLSPKTTPARPAAETLKVEETASELDVQLDSLPTILPTTENSPPADSPRPESNTIEIVPPTLSLDIPEPDATPKATADKPIVTEIPATPVGRGRPKKTQAVPVSPTAPTRHRVPGDYTLTPLLLAEPETAWVHCTNCSTAFVQKDAYYTRANCPRCERHSKLYGYIWPKTEPAGPNDKEKRILDHRTINRFLDPEDEARVRGRKHWKDMMNSVRVSTQDSEMHDRGRARIRGGISEQPVNNTVLDGVRRSGRVRRASARAIGE
ncbi:putative histone-lysine N-methyltransferase set-9 [Podospora fimiseda]|uniref:Histone-lysine N-methyltransferase SET9 n=1 Tax=Podospora fimiseda TaxID=252190 RepID=A0AAN7BI12_9PEZI|nr:putative histone-lysine N-methyltransferase set-9 [Podospora fimiseda]